MQGVPRDEALAYVAGYAPANDVGLHDFRHADRGAMLRVKGQDGFLPIGPAVTPARDFDPVRPAPCARSSTARWSRRRRQMT